MRWVSQQGIVVVTGSTRLDYDQEDIDQFGFRLSASEMARLSAVSAKSDDDELSSSAFYRFEEPSDVGADTAGNSPLTTRSPHGPAYSWRPASDGGIVGGWVGFEEHNKRGGPILNGSSTVFVEQAGAPLRGFGFEALLNFGEHFNREGNTTLFSPERRE